MKTSINLLLWTTRVTDADLRHVVSVRDAGYHGVEVPIHQPDVAHHAMMGGRIRELGLEITASTALPGPQADLLSNDSAVRRAACHYLRSVVDAAAAMGSKVLMGPLYQALGVFTGLPPSATEFARAADGLREVADHAAAADIQLMIEPLNRFECHLLNTMADGARLVEMIGRPNVALVYDTFHANIEERDPMGVIDHFFPVIGHVHLSENHRGAPGAGHLPLKESIRRFLDRGYDGWFVIEAFGTSLPDLAAATRCWRNTFADEREVIEAGADLFARVR